MSRHPNQRSTYAVPGRFPSPHVPVSTGRYRIEKLLDSAWVCMSFGDADKEAPNGRELDKLIQRAEVLEGETRIVRRDGVVIWPALLANGEGSTST